MLRFDGRVLAEVLRDELQRRGVSEPSAHHVAASLIETSLRGVDSHGINLFPYYVSAVEGGRINPTPRFRILTQRAASATLHADHGFGHHAGSAAMELAIEMAAQSGVGVVGVRESTHFGAAAYFAHQASRRGYVAFAFTNADALVKAFGASEPFFGTNPICFTVPLAGEEPLCLDMATSRVSWNKIMGHRRRAEPLLPGWACDEKGEITTQPMQAKMLEPIGDYKGFGLGMMVEILCAGLNEGPVAKDLLPMYGSPLDQKRSISHFFMVLSLHGFVDPQAFGQRMKALAERVRALHPKGQQSVMVPGDPEKKAFAVRSVEGIPLDEDKYAEFLRVSPDFAKAVVP
jgi:LDH2 family malate/lactate/ureidoglycolate dehydrogenase